MTAPHIIRETKNSALYVTFNRPQARNAMTWEMYQGLAKAAEHVNQHPELRALVLRGAGGNSFVAGTDIAQFRGFTGEDGIAYEQRIDEVLGILDAVEKPVIALIDGHCVGGGLGIAACADVRIASPNAAFSVPIAKTLGNTLSARTLGRLVRVFGEARVASMLLTARKIDAEEALVSGFLTSVEDDVESAGGRLVSTITSQAPLTQWSVKENLRRINASDRVDDSDVLATVYGSDDFANAIESFLTKSEMKWRGR